LNVIATAQPRALEIGARVIRCGCSARQKRAIDWHGRGGVPCPRPRAIEDRGVIAAHYRNPLRMFAWRFSQWIRGRRPGVVRFTK
jgi:hypothetical protein